MKRLFVGLILMLVTMVASAQMSANTVYNAGWDKLPETEKAKIVKQIADAAATPAVKMSNAEAVDKWVDTGERIGRMFQGAAKEIGVAVNDFVKTPVGMMTMGVIVWKYMGKDILQVLIAGAFFVTGMITIWVVFGRGRAEVRQYSPDKKDIFGRARLVSVEVESMSDGAMTGMLVSTVILFGITAVIAF